MKYTMLFLLLLTSGMGGIIYVARSSSHAETDIPTTGAINRDVDRIGKRTETPSKIVGVGYVEPLSDVRRLVFRASGVVDECCVQVGQSVEKGDILMKVNATDLSAAIQSARSDVALSIAEREKALSGSHPAAIAAAEQQANLERAKAALADKTLARMRSLALADRRAVSQSDIDSAESGQVVAMAEAKFADAEVERLRNPVRPEDRAFADAKVGQSEAHLSELEAQLEDSMLRAPFAGTVLEILVQPGESAGYIEHEPVIVFGDLSRLRIRAEIEDRYISLLRTGQHVQISANGLGDSSYQGTISNIREIMGKKTVFARTATERKDLDVVQVIIDMSPKFVAPVGLEVDVQVDINSGLQKLR